MHAKYQLGGIPIGHEEPIAVGEALKGLVFVVLAPDYGLLREYGREGKGGVEVDVAAAADLAVGLVLGVVGDAAFGDGNVQAVAIDADVYVWQDDALLPVDAVRVDEVGWLVFFEEFGMRGQILETNEVDFYVAANADCHKQPVVVLLAYQVLTPSYHWLTASCQSIADEPRTRRLFDQHSLQVEDAKLAVVEEDQCKEVGDDDLKVSELDVFLEEDHVDHVLQ